MVMSQSTNMEKRPSPKQSTLIEYPAFIADSHEPEHSSPEGTDVGEITRKLSAFANTTRGGAREVIEARSKSKSLTPTGKDSGWLASVSSPAQSNKLQMRVADQAGSCISAETQALTPLGEGSRLASDTDPWSHAELLSKYLHRDSSSSSLVMRHNEREDKVDTQTTGYEAMQEKSKPQANPLLRRDFAHPKLSDPVSSGSVSSISHSMMNRSSEQKAEVKNLSLYVYIY
ncbi:unnamed protein product [Protopolystoma xenopodis]|uniref:Uncharacterized protein n=1 Tax=Protopolystoma xenopodis TaxID=117903 RepID=A0A448XJN8_9PLAT|nr:unnamed protein product [Protopolystoma xenopodis]